MVAGWGLVQADPEQWEKVRTDPTWPSSWHVLFHTVWGTGAESENWLEWRLSTHWVTFALALVSVLTSQLSVPKASSSCLWNTLWGSHGCMTSCSNTEVMWVGVVGPSEYNDHPFPPRWVISPSEKCALYQSQRTGGWRRLPLYSDAQHYCWMSSSWWTMFLERIILSMSRAG